MKHFILFILLTSFYISRTAASEVEKKGYIITHQGDTLKGTVILRKELGSISSLQFFFQVMFKDSTGNKKTYKPGDLKGYGLALVNDTILTNFLAFYDVEMQGALGKKNETVFLLREVSGYVEVYHLLHAISTGYTHSEVPELYLLNAIERGVPIRLKPKTLKIPMRYRRSDILPHLKDWPESEYSKIHEELSPLEVMTCIVTYNEWRKTNMINNQ